MRIPVLAVLPSQEPLVESAIASALRRQPAIPLDTARTPARLQVDYSFPAVPVGTANRDFLSLEAIQPKASENFVVRGTVEVENADAVPEAVDGVRLFADPPIAPFLTCGGDPPVGGVPNVQARLNIAALAARGLDGKKVAVAIMDTGINLAHLAAKRGAPPRFDAANSWSAPGNPTAPGLHPVHHGTMCAFDALIAAPQATLLDYPVLSGNAPGGAMVGSTLSVAVQAYAHLIAFWAVSFSPGGAPLYSGLVVNNSWGIFHPSWDFPVGHPGRFIDNPGHPFYAFLSLLARNGADILFAAGNCGSNCPDGRCQNRTVHSIMGASAYRDVLTVGGCDTTNLRVGYSSQGPSIPNMFPQKPDLVSYTHFLGSEAFGAGSPDSGTSAACPVAAGCVAALRTRLSPAAAPPGNLFSQLRTTARPAAGMPAGWNGDYGYGILDPDAAAHSLGV
ncbi:S8 family peptidase [Reyranella sp. MMS21-HV4-11]|uniref:S8 family peptidase n=1 Tax=Reyranella humidisoli TaxID=2849149 RepID=A0ABS6IN41_9HYPH|nr:S8 family serine peptidase [Reyranella sp. MMS21-HV4-11]MBU8874605.1 S8 family peptidase [Reyranella sp. MMS21-HV4-11]